MAGAIAHLAHCATARSKGENNSVSHVSDECAQRNRVDIPGDLLIDSPTPLAARRGNAPVNIPNPAVKISNRIAAICFPRHYLVDDDPVALNEMRPFQCDRESAWKHSEVLES